MIKIKRLTICAFRSFREEVSIVFPDTGFILIEGQNVDNGGSSGSGKTSIVEAVAYALGYSKLPATELQNRDTELSLQVHLLLQSSGGGQRIEIARGEKNFIQYYDGAGDKIQKITGAKPIAEEIHKIFGLNLDLVEALTYRPQRSFGRFISMTDSEKKEFLTNCLPELADLEQAAEAARAKNEQIVAQIALISDKVAALDAELERHLQNDPAVQLNPTDLAPIQVQIDQAKVTVDAAHTAYSNAQEALSDATYGTNADRARISTQINLRTESDLKRIETLKELSKTNILALLDVYSTLSIQIKAAEDAKSSLVMKFRSEIAAHQTTYNSLMAVSAKKSSVESSVEKLAKEIESLQNNLCPTCERVWLEGTQKLEALTAEKTALEQKLVLVSKAGVRAAALGRTIDDLEEQAASVSEVEIWALRAQEPAAINAIAEAKAQLKAHDVEGAKVQQDAAAQIKLECAHLDTKLTELGGKRDTLHVEYKSKERELADLNAQLRAAANNNADIQLQIQRYQKTVNEVRGILETEKNSLAPLRAEAAMEASVHLALGRQGYMGSIFDEILAEISNEVSDVLVKVPNVSSISLRFSSEYETKKGTTKRSIVPVITKDGLDAPLSTLSGGQQAAVELAVDLAIGAVVSRRTGRTPGWLILDEALVGLDLPAEEACLHVLKRYTPDRLIVVIDHATEVRELFDTKIQVVMQKGVSSVA